MPNKQVCFTMGRIRSGDMEPCWASLLPDVFSCILEKLTLVDYIRCGSVCTLWRKSVKDKKCSLTRQIPWLLLPGRHGKDSEYRKFWDMPSNKTYCIYLPELRYSKVIGSSEGWLIAADPRSANVYALNPITRAHISFPPATTMPGMIFIREVQRGVNRMVTNQFLKKATMSIEKNNGLICCTVAVLYRSKILLSRNGDMSWTKLKLPSGFKGEVNDIVFHRGLLYLTDRMGNVFAFNFGNGIVSPSLTMKVASWVTSLNYMPRVLNIHLVWLSDDSGCSDEDVLVQVWSCPDFWDKTSVYRVFKLDNVSGRWKEVNDLDGHSLFTVDYTVSPPCVAVSCKCDGISKVMANTVYVACEDSLRSFNLRKWITSYIRGKHYDHNSIANLPPTIDRPLAWITPTLE